jgi:hypothetical protein
MPHYVVTTHLHFVEPLLDGEGKRIAGAYRNVGVTAQDVAAARRVAEDALRGGHGVIASPAFVAGWSETEVSEVDGATRDELAVASGHAGTGVVWHASGHVFYPPDGGFRSALASLVAWLRRIGSSRTSAR